MRKISGDARRHLYKDHNVTVERVDAFAEDSRAVQLEVLTELRSDINDETLTLSLSALVFAIVIPTAAGFVNVRPLDGEIWAIAIAMAIVGLVLGLVLAGALGLPVWVERMRRVRAHTWLRAYEDELARRRSQRGRVARRWQAEH